MNLRLIACRENSRCLIPTWSAHRLGRSRNLSPLWKKFLNSLRLIVQHNCSFVNEIILSVCWDWAGHHVHVGWHPCLRKDLASHCLILLQIYLILKKSVLVTCKVCRLNIMAMSLYWCRSNFVGLDVCDPFNAFHIRLEKPTARDSFPDFCCVYLMIAFVSAVRFILLSFFHLNQTFSSVVAFGFQLVKSSICVRW